MHDDACGVAKFGATFENSRTCRELELRLFKVQNSIFNEGTIFILAWRYLNKNFKHYELKLQNSNSTWRKFEEHCGCCCSRFGATFQEVNFRGYAK